MHGPPKPAITLMSLAAHGSEQGRKPQVVVGLDVLRCAAALMVCLYHYAYAGPSNPNTTLGRALDGVAVSSDWTPLARASFVGVEIFFIISGIVISASTQDVGASQFVRHRLERLLPAAWVCATVTLTVLVLTGNPVRDGYAGAYGRAIFLIPRGPWIDAAYWTLAVELTFYALVAGLIALRRRHWLLVAMGLTGLLSTALSGHMVLARDFAFEARPHILFNFIRYGAAFATGCYLYQITRDKGRSPWMIALCALLAIGTALEVYAAAMADRFNQRPAEATALFSLVFGALLVALAGNRILISRTKVGAQRLIRRAGLATYPFYLLHNFAGATLFGYLARRGFGTVLAAVCTVTVVMIASLLITMYAEPRLRALMRHTTSRILELHRQGMIRLCGRPT